MASRGKQSPIKERPLRNPGQSLDDLIVDKLGDLAGWFFAPMAFLAMVVGMLIIYFQNKIPNPWASVVIALIVLVVSGFQIHRIRKQIKDLRLARDGERSVAEELQPLYMQGAAILHDICADDFNIDHVVICRQGIFLVETKTYRKPGGNPTVRVAGDKILVAGREYGRNPVAQARAEARWLHDLLLKSTGKNFFVRPVIVFPGWFVESQAGSADFWVLNPKALPTFISNLPAILSDEDVHLVTYHISRYVRSFVRK